MREGTVGTKHLNWIGNVFGGGEVLAQWLVAIGKRGFDPVGDSVAKASIASP